MGYHIDVITDSVPEAIRHAGGLMFDYGRAGWQVVVVTDDAAHPRALAILGARTQSPGRHDDRHFKSQREMRTVVSPIGELETNRVPVVMEGSRLEPQAQLVLWGQHVDIELTSALCPVRHDLSQAARTFKAQALHSTGHATRVEYCEHFWADNILDAGLFRDPMPAAKGPHLESDAQAGSRSPTAMGGFARG